MVRQRSRARAGPEEPCRRRAGAALRGETFDRVVSIGCLHHTGDPRARSGGPPRARPRRTRSRDALQPQLPARLVRARRAGLLGRRDGSLDDEMRAIRPSSRGRGRAAHRLRVRTCASCFASSRRSTSTYRTSTTTRSARASASRQPRPGRRARPLHRRRQALLGERCRAQVLGVPTRDRPDLLDFCLAGLAEQTLTRRRGDCLRQSRSASAPPVFDRLAGRRLALPPPEQPVPMHDNFERGCDAASGDYVTVLIDKRCSILRRSSGEQAWSGSRSRPRELAQRGLLPRSTRRGRSAPGASSRPAKRGQAARPSTRAWISSAIRERERRGVDPVHYVRGKIVFGAYSQALLERIRARPGRVFLRSRRTTPRWCRPARSLRALSTSGGRCSSRTTRAFQRATAEPLSRLRPPLHRGDRSRRSSTLSDPGPLHVAAQLVGYDLVSSAERCPPGSTPTLDMVNLVRRVREDLAAVLWPDAAVREEQYALLEAEEARQGVNSHLGPRAPSLLRRAMSSPPPARAPEPVDYLTPAGRRAQLIGTMRRRPS